MTTRNSVHDTFRLERHYAAEPARVFHAWSDADAKAQWFGRPETQSERVFDFREGGRDATVTVHDGTRYSFAATYIDIVPGERIVYAYEMAMNGTRISVSVATIEIRAAAGGGTDLVVTEQGVYLDGLDDPAKRREGTVYLLDNLEKALS